MKIYLRDSDTNWWEKDFEPADHYTLLCEVEEQDADYFGRTLEINGKFYTANQARCVGGCDRDNRKYIHMIVSEVEHNDSETSHYGDEFQCPVCKAIVSDAHELGDEGTYDCSCGTELNFDVEYEVSYSISVKKKAEPIKIK